MPQSSATYNMKWGNTTKSISFITAQEMCAQYKKKMRSVLRKNKALVRALVAAKTELEYFKQAASCWAKKEDLYLPMLNLWLGADLEHIRALFENHVRATRLLKSLLTPGAEVTLTAGDSLLNDRTSESPDKEPASVRPKGIRNRDPDRSMSMVRDEEVDTTAPFPTEDVAAQEIPVSAETEVVLAPQKLGGQSLRECNAVLDHQRKPRRTSCSADKEGARFHPLSEGVGSSPPSTRVQHRGLSPPAKPVSAIRPRRKSSMTGAMPQGLRGPVIECSPGMTDTPLPSPPCVFDMAFIETPSPTQILSKNIQLPEKAAPSPGKLADFGVDDNSPLEARTRPKKSTLKSRPSKGGQQKADSLPSALQPWQDRGDDEKPLQARKSRNSKSRGKKTADSEKRAPPQPAEPSSSPPAHTAPRGRLVRPDSLNAGPSSSVGEGSPPRRPSGLPVRSVTKCATYKEPDMREKLRRP